MNEEIAILLYEDPHRSASRHAGRVTPAVEIKGWDYAVGDTLWLDAADGGSRQGTIESIADEVHTDGHAGRYRVAHLRLED